MNIEIYPGLSVSGIGTLPLDVVARDGGLKALQDMLVGQLPAPPMAQTLRFTLKEVEEGRVVFVGYPTAEHLNPLGTVHGGWTATVMDSALGCAVFSVTKPGEAYTTVEFKVNLVRPVLPDMGEVFCEGKIVHRGRTIATSEAWLRDSAGKLLAHGTETCAIFPISNLMR
ncbi:PaaI family thioesterase [Sinorhizobium sp. BG8]|uniref:PaaI family thioesterase n=1 Tax=Sinorhizobium sp. BG8 TaxID=2613773 RepID=UPI00193D8278|nr:PaaI family thioesterase [Sinorhizobium sp. BG8]QRM54829.1 PaaI family thioesterase [Sinorhizobium sp. BG8]